MGRTNLRAEGQEEGTLTHSLAGEGTGISKRVRDLGPPRVPFQGQRIREGRGFAPSNTAKLGQDRGSQDTDSRHGVRSQGALSA